MAINHIRKFMILFVCLTTWALPAIAQRGDPTQQTVVYHLPSTDKVLVQADTIYKTAGDVQLKLDTYYPPTLKKDDRLPVVIFINGVGNRDGFPKFKTWGQYTNWARLVAASGFAAINYDSRSGETEADSKSLLDYVRANAAKLNINENKIVIWACSANGPVGTKIAFEERPYLSAAVFYYAVIDLPPLLRDLPLFIARAGLDNPNLNQGLDVFAQSAIAQGLQISFVNYAEGQHAFDLFDDTDQSREIISQTIAFMKFHLTQYKAAQANRAPSPGRFIALINTLGWSKALEIYEAARRTDPQALLFTEQALNGVGYNLLQNKKVKEAIEVFKLVVASYPNSPNAYDSLADAYVEDGNKAEATKNSEKALELLDKDTTTPAQMRDQIRQSARQKLQQLKGN
jgi:tetratricopeptide (TPR) repeat protein